jgi:hypothetical protein
MININDINWIFRHQKATNGSNGLKDKLTIGNPFAIISVSDYDGINKYNFKNTVSLAYALRNNDIYFLTIKEKWSIKNLKKNTIRYINEDSIFATNVIKYDIFAQKIKDIQKSLKINNVIIGQYNKQNNFSFKIINYNNDIVFSIDDYVIENINDINFIINKRTKDIGNEKFKIEKFEIESLYRYCPESLYIAGGVDLPKYNKLMGFNERHLFSK